MFATVEINQKLSEYILRGHGVLLRPILSTICNQTGNSSVGMARTRSHPAGPPLLAREESREILNPRDGSIRGERGGEVSKRNVPLQPRRHLTPGAADSLVAPSVAG